MQCGKIQGWVCLIVGGLIIFGLLRAFMRRRAAGSGGDPRYGRQVGYGGDPGVGQSGYGMGGGAGFGRGILGGLLGGMLGGAAYDHLRGRGSQADASTTEGGADQGTAREASGGSGFGDSSSDVSAGGSDFGDSGGGGGDSAGGSDF